MGGRERREREREREWGERKEGERKREREREREKFTTESNLGACLLTEFTEKLPCDILASD